MTSHFRFTSSRTCSYGSESKGHKKNNDIQLFRESLSEKVHATVPKGIVGGFKFTVLQRNLKELAQKAVKMCLRVLKESNKSRFNSYSRVRNSVSIISHITFSDCRVPTPARAHFFPTTSLEIDVQPYITIYS